MADGVADVELPDSLPAVIRHEGCQPRRHVQVSLTVDAAEVATETIDLEPGQALCLADAAAARVLAGGAILIDKHHRQCRHHRHDEAAAVVFGHGIARQRHRRRHEGRPPRLDGRVEEMGKRHLPRLP
ncbi:MAG: hypothetical protein ACKOWG_12170, partial [Planctomycetia bacterium]